MSVSIAIIAAVQREVAPLVKRWKIMREGVPEGCRCFASGTSVVMCAGMGWKAARHAAEAAVKQYKPELLVSAGLAGALVADIKAGEVLVPSTVINSGTGERFSASHGSGILVSASAVAGPEAKTLFARQYGAQMVDMEAAAVASVAKQYGVAFTAVKAISDEVDFEVPDFEPFVDPNGRFLTAKFVSHMALRPRMWGVVRKLAANSTKASAGLCVVLHRLIEEETQKSAARSTPVFKGKE